MTSQERLSLQTLDKALLRKTAQLLREEKIWKFDTFGWINANDPDPEFIGHAMWQTDEPSDVYLYHPVFGRGSNKTSPPEPEEWQKLSAVSGADFCGLMETALMTIGLLLFQAQLMRANMFHDDSLFDLHWMSANIYLSTASDRLRDLFITTVYQKSPKKYKSHGPDNGKKTEQYSAPFKEANDPKNPPPLYHDLAESFGQLPAMAAKIHLYREHRNEIIHEVATAIGRHERKMLNEETWKNQMTKDRSFSELEHAKDDAKAAHEKRISDTISDLRDWYFLLAKASNEVFIIENKLRHARHTK
jgi:hypothetical protein